jgi:trimeric autotransporter adhesin
MKPTPSALTLAALLLTSLPVLAQVELHVFRPGERARAADVNGNFTNLKNAVEAAERRNAELTNRIRDLEAALGTLRALNDVISIEDTNGIPTVRFTGVNLQVVNGTNSTEGINGSGNIIIGYDEPNTIINETVCSRATAVNGALITDEAGCLAAGGVFASQHKSGSHNLVLGSHNNYSSAAGIVAGRGNFINQIYASSLGGAANIASGRFSVIVAGSENRTLDAAAAVLGGAANSASGRNSTVSGGGGNLASEFGASVSGGSRNTASASQSSVSGGTRNTASANFSTVSGGSDNTASGTSSSISGGTNRNATGTAQTLP